jgi:hypothetical protein
MPALRWSIILFGAVFYYAIFNSYLFFGCGEKERRK